MSLDSLTLAAYAKVNLVLNVTGQRPDGYHELETIFQRVDLHDRLTLTKSHRDGIRLRCDLPGVPPEANIVWKAYHRLKELAPALGGLDVVLEKRIPTQAGMGGGSADCAAFLLGANRLWDLGLSQARLLELGAQLGADVPACLLGGTALGRGIGEKLTPIPSALVLHLAVVQPPVAFFTPEMFRRLDAFDVSPRQRFTAAEAVRALEDGDLESLCRCLYNVFEEAVPSPVIEEIKGALAEQGALGSLMTGSGSCVFGLFPGDQEARAAAQALAGRWKTWACRSTEEELLS